MSFASKLPYDRAERRLEDQRHGNVASGDYGLDETDDVARATYPDPKARSLKIAAGETSVLDEKYELAEQDRAASGDLDDYKRPQVKKQTKDSAKS